MMDQGVTIGCDRFGIDVYNSTADRVATVAALCGQGYAPRIVLSHDASCYIDYFSGEDWQAAKEQAVPNWHYEHIHRDVLPALREQGVTDEQIETMLVDNPRRYFES
jgi:phosphotriesterase-related protein